MCKYACTYVCMHACMHACMDGWMDGWMDGCMDGWMYVFTYVHRAQNAPFIAATHQSSSIVSPPCEADAPEAPEASSLMSEIQAHVEKE